LINLQSALVAQIDFIMILDMGDYRTRRS